MNQDHTVDRNYLVAGVEHWNRQLFDLHSPLLPGQWHYVDDPSSLESSIETFRPRCIFFLHWRWKVPVSVINQYECIGFHMTDLPYGRGGSPLQNLIVRGHRETKLTALRLTEAFDAGPIYKKRALSLEGKASQIYQRASESAWEMIADLVKQPLEPIVQQGTVTHFERRKPADSKVPAGLSMQDLYDYIRMLDAPGYPSAYLEAQGYRIAMKDAKAVGEQLEATVIITRSESHD